MIRISVLFVILISMFSLSCAYKLGGSNRGLPGGYTKISIPIFKNTTQETAIETSFTNAITQEFLSSRIAQVTDEKNSELELRGQIVDVKYTPTAFVSSGDPSVPFMPTGSVLAVAYRIQVSVSIQIVKKNTQEVLWKSSFSGERTYTSPQVTLAGLNTLNPLYNLSARRQNISSLAVDLMSEAHDRITEKF